MLPLPLRHALNASALAGALAAPLLTPLAAFAQALPDAAAVSRFTQELLDRENIAPQGPGLAVLVARGDQLLVQTARGAASLELGVPLGPEQRFRLGSVTKQFASALLLKLVDEGRASLDDPLSKYLPQYPNGQAITLTMLLNHTGGMKSYTGISGYMGNPVRRDLSTAELVKEFQDQPVDFAPGSAWAYNNSGYVLVGAIIEAITGKPWWEGLSALKTPVFYPAPERLIPGHVAGYTRGEGGKFAPAGLISMSQPHAAGALVGDLQSLWRWNQLLHEGAFLKPASYQRMTTPEGAAVASKYGYGLFIDSLRGERLIQHGGAIHGFNSMLQYLPAQRITVALLRNADGGMNLDAIARQLAAFAAGKPFPKPQTLTLAPTQLKAFEGVYSQGKDSRRLRVVDGALTSQRNGGAVQALAAVGPARFIATTGPAQIAFERDAEHKVSGLRFFAEGDGEGELWTRNGDLPQRADLVLSEAQKQALLGEYLSPQFRVKVYLGEQGQLMGQAPGQPAFALKAAGPRELYTTVVDATLLFEPADGLAASATLVQGPARITMQRQ
ncbi:beta-lactamase family protein [Paucibacter sp. DJ1R-11]|uniref:serine hydrolase domain-containing protein n=1 Tax=Paucibacter sp. DJ1R-11 TaxID=2893556 RepID=UPI0021E4168D|nr:serine hydrolase domain-containing protein [Paucibacter sp. DJ1R-11]MCV2361950.1 beta-lactamase family protein [Paucibacter sp. DJ1R-11]